MNANTPLRDETAEILTQALAWMDSGQPVALATVTATWGSSPRPVGSLLAVSAGGDFVGSVSGGCVEGAVIGAAADVIRDGTPQRLEFGVSNDQAWDVGLACGGSIAVQLERIEPQMIAPIVEAGSGRQALARVIAPGSGRSAIYRQGEAGDAFPLGPEAAEAAQEALRQRRSGTVSLPSGEAVFVRVFNPSPRLIAVGAVHIAQYLAPVAALAGFEVILVDPREAFASRQRFPQATLVDAWPDKALRALTLDAQCAVVTLSHDPKLDEPALRVALESPAFYIGALGSKKTHAARLGRLAEAGFDADQQTRIHGPIGLDLGGRAPAEIAIAIMAQIIQVLHR